MKTFDALKFIIPMASKYFEVNSIGTHIFHFFRDGFNLDCCLLSFFQGLFFRVVESLRLTLCVMAFNC